MVEDAPIMASSSDGSMVRTVVPQGAQVYISPRGKSKYSKVKWKKYKGWVPNASYSISDPKGKSKRYSQSTNTHNIIFLRGIVIAEDHVYVDCIWYKDFGEQQIFYSYSNQTNMFFDADC